MLNDVMERCPDCGYMVASAFLSVHRRDHCAKNRVPEIDTPTSDSEDLGWTCPACGTKIIDPELAQMHIAFPHGKCLGFAFHSISSV